MDSRRLSSLTSNSRWEAFLAACLVMLSLLYRQFLVRDYQMFQDNMVLLVGGLLFGLHIWKLNKWIGAFTILVALRSFGHPSDFAYYLGGVLLFSWIVTSTESVEPLYDMIALLAIISCILIPLQLNGFGRALGLTGNENTLAAFLAFSFPAFFRKRWWPGLIIVVPGLAAADCWGGFLSVLAGIVYYVFAIKWKYRWHTVICLISMGFATLRLADPPGTERLVVWLITLKYFFVKHFWLGAGLGMFNGTVALSNDLIRATGMKWIWAHNEVLQAMYEFGIFSLFIILGFMLQCNRSRAALPIMGVVIVFANSLVNFPFHIGSTRIVATVLIAIAVKAMIEERRLLTTQRIKE